MRTVATKVEHEKRWVVYEDSIGVTDPGVYCRRVTVDGNIAFVHPLRDSKSRRADIVPAMNVHKTKEAAHAFYTGKGELKWVVFSEKWDDIPEVFRARVKLGRTATGTSGEYALYVTKQDGTTMMDRVHYSDDYLFDTEEQAEAALRRRLPNIEENILKDHSKAEAQLKKLRAVQKRLGPAPRMNKAPKKATGRPR